MKKLTILIAALLLSLTASLKAQDENDSRGKFHIGLKAGANYSNVYDEQGDNFHAHAKFGFVGGGFIQIPIGKYIGIHPEILFSQKGYQGYGNVNDPNTSYTYYRTTNFLDIPLLLAIKPSRHFTILAGPQYSYLMSQSDVFTGNNTASYQEQDFRNDNLRKNILAGVVGFDINAGGFVFGGRYGFDLQNNNGDGTSTVPRYKNVWLQGTLGYRF
ncbi:MAG: hypothetical protein JWP12_3566 [Bacteroidetes bacterium]|nr:hypothetical protein [Bacteroidota bacterium]